VKEPLIQAYSTKIAIWFSLRRDGAVDGRKNKVGTAGGRTDHLELYAVTQARPM